MSENNSRLGYIKEKPRVRGGGRGSNEAAAAQIIIQATEARSGVGGSLKVFVDRPPGAPRWEIRVVFTLLYPKK